MYYNDNGHKPKAGSSEEFADFAGTHHPLLPAAPDEFRCATASRAAPGSSPSKILIWHKSERSLSVVLTWSAR